MMRSLFAAVLLVSLFGFAPRSYAAFDLQSLLGAAAKFVQNILPQEEEGNGSMEEQNPEDFVDPKEIQRVTMDIKNMRRELNRFAKQIQKLPNSADDATQIQNLLGELVSIDQKLQSGEDLRETLRDFYDARIWEEINKIRAKVEVPKEISQWTKEIKRAEKSLGQKKYQAIGLTLEGAKQKLQEVKGAIVQIESFYNAGDLEGAIEALDEIRQDFHPGEIMGVVQRMYEIATTLKKVKDASVKTQIQNVLQEVVAEFNSGEYRSARELMDEATPEIMRTISSVLAAGKKGSKAKVNVQSNMEKLGEKIREKMENIRLKDEEMDRKREEMKKAPEPQQIQPQQPQPQTVQPQPMQSPASPSLPTGGEQALPVAPQP